MTERDDLNRAREMSQEPDGKVTAVHDWTDSVPVSITVLEALEEATGQEPHSYGPLNDVIDVDALDNLFQPTGNGSVRGPGYVTFEIEGHTATVHSDGSVVVAPHDD